MIPTAAALRRALRALPLLLLLLPGSLHALPDDRDQPIYLSLIHI